VRGFREGGISGDRGFYLRSDLIWSHVPEWNGIRSEPYAFLDAGRTELIARARYEQIVGTGVGVRLQAAYGKQILSGEVLAGRPLQQPAELGKKKTIVLATLNWTY
jgi:hemolysin activation/secretion protein